MAAGRLHSGRLRGPRFRSVVAAAALGLLAPVATRAQQPFFTDDSAVTARGLWHFELSSSLVRLQDSAAPARSQSTTDLEVGYGLPGRLELAAAAPFIVIRRSEGSSPRSVSGIGDTNLALKWNFVPDPVGVKAVSHAVTVNVEMPTGDPDQGLGSGVADVGLNWVLQNRTSEALTLRLNLGLVRAGNTLTGAVGLKAQGLVGTGGLSVVRSFGERLQLGAEVYGAYAEEAELGRGQLLVQVGGNWTLRAGLTLDFGVFAGAFVGSPRAGFLLGGSWDP
jgi:hypothetical protein